MYLRSQRKCVNLRLPVRIYARRHAGHLGNWALQRLQGGFLLSRDIDYSHRRVTWRDLLHLRLRPGALMP